MAKAVVFFAEGTEECEALLVVDLLRRAKVEVLVASASGSREILSSHKVHITADALAEEVDYSDVDLVVLPGGIPGTPNLAANKTVTDTCAAFAKAGKKVAAICAAPSVLAALGLLEGKNATAHAAFQDKLAGAHVLDTEVGVDGNYDPFCRKPFPWDPALQDTQLLALYQRMAKLRKAHQALRYGGCQVNYAEDNVVVFVRVYKQQRVLVAINRGEACEVVIEDSPLLNVAGWTLQEGAGAFLDGLLTLPAISANVWSGR